MMMSMFATGDRPVSRAARLLGTASPERIAWMAVGVMLALLPAALILAAIDPRQIDGVGIWAKPIKFQLSLFVHFATLALLVRLLVPVAQARFSLRLGFTLAALAALLEILYIVLQAARGRASHFNTETPLEAWLYQAMGVGAVVIVAAAMQLGFALWRGARAEADPGLVTGALLGLLGGGIATLIVAGVLGSGEIAGPTHLVGAGDDVLTDKGGLALFGWSRQAGDLRVPHFFATHLMQALPLIGLAADRFGVKSPRLAVVAAAICGLALVAATFIQAVDGMPFLPDL